VTEQLTHPTTEQSPPPKDVDDRSPLRKALDVIGVQNVSLLIALAALVLIIGSQHGEFFRISNFKVIGQAVAVVGLLAVVQTIVIILGGLDISVGSAAGVGSVVSAMVFMSTDGNPWIGILVALLVGVAGGLINGCAIIYGRVNPVVATLATLAAFKGLAQLLSDGRAQGYTGADSLFVFIARGSMIGIPTLIWILIVVAAGAHVLLRHTDMGRNIYAIGGNDVAARLAGININRYILAVYALTGLVAALAGILITARTGSGQPVSGSEGLELQAVTAAALGGCALQGGRGTIPGTVLAVMLLGVLDNGITLFGVNPFWQNVARGTLLVVAVVIQQLRSGERRVGMPT
jgi:L-arabinose transport system permease protein